MFAAVEIAGPDRESLVVPADAVLDTGRRQVVFTADGDGYYTPRDVKVGARVNDQVEVLDGLALGQRVAASALFFLDSESQLRAALEGYAPALGFEGSTRTLTSAQQLSIDFSTIPDPLKAGPARFIVRVRDADAQALQGAEVTVLLYMPPMPSMNMPAMRSEVRLSALPDGTYAGTGEVMMPGRWDVTVTVQRGGTRLGSRQLTLVAR
jgi:Cu(I)/Ag(I) efflux system membrane fusion protein/cobalt-zinc-cadmium efflux system membrane fusion protein